MARVELWHLESPANTDSQALKQAEIEGEAKKWKNAKFPLHLAIYIDVLTPLKKLSLGFQKEKHDPVLAARCIKEFDWTMSKLQLSVDSSLSGDNGDRLIHLVKLFKEISEDHKYQDIKLAYFDIHCWSVSALAIAMEERFNPLSSSPVFNNLMQILDVLSWSCDDNMLSTFRDDEIKVLTQYYEMLLCQNG